MTGLLEFLLPFVVILVLLVVWWYGTIPKNIPPGPRGLPIVGCALEVNPATAHLKLLEWAKKYGPIYSFYQATKLIVVLSDYEQMQEALQKQGEIFGGKPSFMTVKGRPPKHGKRVHLDHA